MSTTVLAIILGIILVTTIKPGIHNNVKAENITEVDVKQEARLPEDTLMDLVR